LLNVGADPALVDAAGITSAAHFEAGDEANDFYPELYQRLVV